VHSVLTVKGKWVSRKLRLDLSSGDTLPADQSTNIGTRVDRAKA